MKETANHISEALIVSYLNGGLNDENQIKQVEEWLAVEENLNHAREVYKTWELSVLAAPARGDTDKAFDQLSRKLNLNANKKVINLSYWWYAAASILLVLGLIFFLQSPKELELVTLSSGQNVEDHQLPDGSELTLNTQSVVRFNATKVSSGAQRLIELKGEAFFEVAHDPERPFIIQTSDAEVKVLGTKFMVKTSREEPTSVLVTEGKVQVKYLLSSEIVTLTAEEEVQPLQAEDQIDLLIIPSDENKLYWKTGVMEFQMDSLGKVFETLSEEFGTSILAENTAILSCDITATFKKQSLETIIEVIKSTHQLESYEQGDAIILTGDGCQ